LEEDEIVMLRQKMFYTCVDKGKYVFKQNDKASCFFVIANGKVSVEINKVVKRVLDTGASFGELALLYNAPRSASIKCDTKTYFWVLDRSNFRSVVDEVTSKKFKENREFIEKITIFTKMTENQKDSIASAMITQTFFAGQELVCQGDQADSYFLIKEGDVECILDGNTMVRELHAGDSFGEQA
jgi:cGMP-dependent protein kinase